MYDQQSKMTLFKYISYQNKQTNKQKFHPSVLTDLSSAGLWENYVIYFNIKQYHISR